MKAEVFVLRRNRGTGGAERAAERLASQFEGHYRVQRMWAGRRFGGRIIPGRSGPAWWRSWRYSRFLDRLQLQGMDRLVLSLEYGPNCDIYRAGDGVHRLNVLRRYGQKKGWMFNPWHWYAPQLERKCLESAKVIVANSNLVKSLIAGEYPHLAAKVITVYNGFDPEQFYPLDGDNHPLRQELCLPESECLLLLSGHGFVRKGLHHAIGVLAHMVHGLRMNAHLMVVGKGDRRYVDKQISQAKLEARVLFRGSIQNVRDYYQAADFMILPTRHDPFSNACLEALACGCPVITSDQNGVAEVLNESNGLVMSSNHYGEDLYGAAANFAERFSDTRETVAASVAHLTQADEIAQYFKLADEFFAQQS